MIAAASLFALTSCGGDKSASDSSASSSSASCEASEKTAASNANAESEECQGVADEEAPCEVSFEEITDGNALIEAVKAQLAQATTAEEFQAILMQAGPKFEELGVEPTPELLEFVEAKYQALQGAASEKVEEAAGVVEEYKDKAGDVYEQISGAAEEYGVEMPEMPEF